MGWTEVPTMTASRDQLPLFRSSRTPLLADRQNDLRPPVRLSEAARAYCAYLVERDRAEHTVRSTTLDLAGLVEHLGDMELAQLSAEMLQSHLHWLQTSRNNHTSSLRRKIASLKGLFRHVQGSGWLATDPAATLVYPPPHRLSIVALRPAEEAAAIAATSDPLWLALVLLFLDCGLKRDEVLALRAEDVLLGQNTESSLISVRRAAHAQRARVRALRVTERLRTALTALLGSPLPGRQVVDLSVRGVNFVVETIGHRAGLTRVPTLTPEILRDTFAVRSMADYLERERRLVDQRATPRTLAKARAQHDHELLEALGLSRQSDGPARYRRAAEELRAEATGVGRPDH